MERRFGIVGRKSAADSHVSDVANQFDIFSIKKKKRRGGGTKSCPKMWERCRRAFLFNEPISDRNRSFSTTLGPLIMFQFGRVNIIFFFCLCLLLLWLARRMIITSQSCQLKGDGGWLPLRPLSRNDGARPWFGKLIKKRCWSKPSIARLEMFSCNASMTCWIPRQ